MTRRISDDISLLLSHTINVHARNDYKDAQSIVEQGYQVENKQFTTYAHQSVIWQDI